MAEHTASSNPSLPANWAANVEWFVTNSIMRFCPAAGNVTSRRARLNAGPVRSRPAQQEGDRLHGAHAHDLNAVALERDVIAEPLRLLCGVGVAVGVHQQPNVVERLPIGGARPGQL